MLQTLPGDYPILENGAEIGKLTVRAQGLFLIFETELTHEGKAILRLALIEGDKLISLGVLMPQGENRLYFKKSYTKNDLRILGVSKPQGFVVTDGTANAEKSAAALSQKIWNGPAYAEELAESTKKPTAEPAKKPKSTDETPSDAVQLSNLPTIETAEMADDFSDEICITKEWPPQAAPRLSEKNTNETEENKSEAVSAGFYPIENPADLFADADLKKAARGITDALAKKEVGQITLAVPAEACNPFPLMPILCLGESCDLDGKHYITFKIKNGNIST